MKPYIPEKLPLKELDHKRLIASVGDANAELARYDGLLQAVVNPEILLSPLTTREAVLSSKIEGTLATLDEVLKHEAGIKTIDESKNLDIQEIVNYRSVLISAEKVLSERPISLHLIRQMHKQLMTSVRGSSKHPGEFRNVQNWIGKPGTPIGKATFIPPQPKIMLDHLEFLQEYMKTIDSEVLIQSAVIHAQFELIHPFLDGNGRIGRLLIPLFLYQRKRLSRPMFYLSEYLENSRNNYYSKLQGISKNWDWNSWIEFYLKAVKSQARLNSVKVKKILDLYEQMKKKIFDITRSPYTVQILDSIFYKAIFQASDIIHRTQIPRQTLMPILKQLQESNILAQLRASSGRRPAVLVFSNLLSIIEE
jgi:Fic family protein